MTVLFVEGDTAVGASVRDQLESRGLAVTLASTLAEGRDLARHRSFDTVILDLLLPDGSGLILLRELREANSSAHIIVLSGAANEDDRVTAFELGANDYVVKPFFGRELTARVLGVRRPLDLDGDSRLHVGHLDIDLVARRVLDGEEALELTMKEFDLLAFLAARPGHVFSRDELLRSVWHSKPGWQQSATVTEHVRRLRAKIERDPQRPHLLKTVRGAGYRFDNPLHPAEL